MSFLMSNMDAKSLRFIAHQSFFSAVRTGDLDAIKRHVKEEGSDPSALMALQDDAGKTALYIASENNLEDVFNYLIGFCDLQTVMIRSKADSDAFHVAAARGYMGNFFFFSDSFYLILPL